jgi:hypothetical protein
MNASSGSTKHSISRSSSSGGEAAVVPAFGLTRFRLRYGGQDGAACCLPGN